MAARRKRRETMSRRAKGAWLLAGFGFALAALVGPGILSIYTAIVEPTIRLARGQGLARAWVVASALAGYWAKAQIYLPWHAWPAIIGHRRVLLVWLLLTLVVVAFLASRAWGTGRSRLDSEGPPAAGQGEHGTARFRASSEMYDTLSVWRPNVPEERISGIYLGQGPKPGTAWVHEGEGHVLLLGATRSGKSRRVILPTIGVIGSAKKESLIVTDPKGELWAHSAAWLRKQGYKLIRFDLRDPPRGNQWNPMDAVIKTLEAGRRDHASAAARDIAHVITYSVDHHGDALWPQAQEALISSLIQAMARGEIPGGRWRQPQADERHMSSVYNTLLAGGAGGGRLDDLFEQLHWRDAARQTYGAVELSVDKTRSSILTGAAAELSLFADEEIAWLTAKSDHDLADVGRRPTAVFLVIPDERSTRYPLATLYVQQTLQALVALADEQGGRLPLKVNILLDEFGNLPRIQDFDKAVTVMGGRGIRLLLALQDLAQIKRHYELAAQTIKGNLATWGYLSTADNDTAREISDKMGQYTVAAQNLSIPRTTWWTNPNTVGTATTTHALQARPLRTLEEVLYWQPGRDGMLLLQAGQHPAKLPLPDLSAWADVWPDIQQPSPPPPAREMVPPPIWRPPDEQEEAQSRINDVEPDPRESTGVSTGANDQEPEPEVPPGSVSFF